MAWLGDIPAHWTVKRLRFAAKWNPSKSDISGLEVSTLVSFLPMEAIGENGSLDLSRQRPIAELQGGYSYFQEGDIAIAKITPCFENGKGAVLRGLTNGLGFGTTELIVARPLPKEVTADYLHLIFASSRFRQMGEAQMYGAGGQKRVPDAFVRDFKIGLPRCEEQEAITSFVAQQSQEIDALIGAQRRLLELLKERRQAVMSHAVTKGLNPDVPTKPSGVDWIGDVPEHWNSGVKLKSLAVNRPSAFTNGPFGSDLLTTELRDEGVPVIYIRDITPGAYRRTSASYVSPAKAQQLDKFRVDADDILIAKVGDPPGSCCVYPEGEPSGIVCQDVVRLAPNPARVVPRFLSYLLNSRPGVESINAVCVEATRKRFSLSDFQSLRFSLPPVPEQRAIVKWLDTLLPRYDELESEAEQAIGLLNERRTALISAAVTGKIDVRGLTAVEAT